MIEGLSAGDLAWLGTFFTAPNGLDWEVLQSGTSPAAIAAHVRPWLQRLATGDRHAPVLVPFIRAGEIVGWYATTQNGDGGPELGAELEGWLGPTFLSTVHVVPFASNDAVA